MLTIAKNGDPIIYRWHKGYSIRGGQGRLDHYVVYNHFGQWVATAGVGFTLESMIQHLDDKQPYQL